MPKSQLKQNDEAYIRGYSAGISNINCICKNHSPIEDYTVIRKGMLKFLLEKSSEPENVKDLFK